MLISIAVVISLIFIFPGPVSLGSSPTWQRENKDE